MNEIYLAASNRTEINLLAKAIYNRSKDAKVTEVATEDFQKILYGDYQLLVISPEYLTDPSSMDFDKLVGKQICYWHSDYIPQIVNEKLYVFPDVKSAYQWIYQGEAYNDSIAFTQTTNNEILKKGEKKSSAPAPRKKDDVKNDEESSKKNNKVEVRKSKSEQESTSSVEEDANEFKPVSVSDPYPALDNEIKERIKSEIPENVEEEFEDIDITEEHHSSPQTDVHYEHDPFSERAVKIRKEAFSHANWDRNKTIGIWSPLHRVGVTTLIFTIALHFGKLKVPTAAVEGLTNNQLFKTLLSQYCNVPEGWTSFLSALQDENAEAHKVEWTYNNVHWLPIGDRDIEKHEWSKEHIKHYLRSVKYYDVVFVDLPTGKMAQHTLDTLEHLDELFILIDGSYQQVLAWKTYIQSVIKEYNIPVNLIFIKKYSFSKPQKIAEKLELPLLTVFPDLSEAIYRNYHEKIPLIDQSDSYRLLEKPLTTITEHILGEEYTFNQKVPILKRLKWFLNS